MIKAAKKTYYTDLIMENKQKPKILWRCIKELLPGNKKTGPKGLLISGKIVTDKKIMAIVGTE